MKYSDEFARILLNDPDIKRAVAELQDIIRARYPDALFEVVYDEEPVGVYLFVIIDIEDIADVIDVYLDRMVDIQLEEDLPVYIHLVHPSERTAEMLRQHRENQVSTPVRSAG